MSRHLSPQAALQRCQEETEGFIRDWKEDSRSDIHNGGNARHLEGLCAAEARLVVSTKSFVSATAVHQELAQLRVEQQAAQTDCDAAYEAIHRLVNPRNVGHGPKGRYLESLARLYLSRSTIKRTEEIYGRMISIGNDEARMVPPATPSSYGWSPASFPGSIPDQPAFSSRGTPDAPFSPFVPSSAPSSRSGSAARASMALSAPPQLKLQRCCEERDTLLYDWNKDGKKRLDDPDNVAELEAKSAEEARLRLESRPFSDAHAASTALAHIAAELAAAIESFARAYAAAYERAQPNRGGPRKRAYLAYLAQKLLKQKELELTESYCRSMEVGGPANAAPKPSRSMPPPSRPISSLPPTPSPRSVAGGSDGHGKPGRVEQAKAQLDEFVQNWADSHDHVRDSERNRTLRSRCRARAIAAFAIDPVRREANDQKLQSEIRRQIQHDKGQLRSADKVLNESYRCLVTRSELCKPSVKKRQFLYELAVYRYGQVMVQLRQGFLDHLERGAEKAPVPPSTEGGDDPESRAAPHAPTEHAEVRHAAGHDEQLLSELKLATEAVDGFVAMWARAAVSVDDTATYQRLLPLVRKEADADFRRRIDIEYRGKSSSDIYQEITLLLRQNQGHLTDQWARLANDRWACVTQHSAGEPVPKLGYLKQLAAIAFGEAELHCFEAYLAGQHQSVVAHGGAGFNPFVPTERSPVERPISRPGSPTAVFNQYMRNMRPS